MSQKPFPYQDLLNLPYPRPSCRARMSMVERAAQFAPFAALTGYEDAIEETARLTGTKIELDEMEKEILDRKLQHLASLSRPLITVTHYVPDSSKDGGTYVTDTFILKKADPYGLCLISENETIIALGDILAIHSPLLED